jgi:hypothetical protein
MSRLIYITMMSLFIGSITLGLAGCNEDYETNNGYSRTGTGSIGTVRRNQANGGTRYQADPSDVMAGGFGG